jgi:hypothetical protein
VQFWTEIKLVITNRTPASRSSHAWDKSQSLRAWQLCQTQNKYKFGFKQKEVQC